MSLYVKNLDYQIGNDQILKQISLEIRNGEFVGLVGPNGCGKSTLGRTVIGLYEPTDGQILFEGKDVTHLKGKERKEFSKNIQMIFQDPYASLNPRMTGSDIIGEGLDIHKIYKGEARQKRIFELLDLVGLSQEHASRFPHEFSGGSASASASPAPWPSSPSSSSATSPSPPWTSPSRRRWSTSWRTCRRSSA